MTFFRDALNGVLNFLARTGGTAGAVTFRRYCPHCNAETAVHVNVLHPFARCSQCGRDPERSPSHHETSDGEDSGRLESLHRPDRAGEPATGPTGHREAMGENTAA